MRERFTLVAVHGNGGGGFRFERMRPLLPEAVRFEAVTLPGFGGKPADPSLRTLRDYALRLREMVRALAGPHVVLGHGIGGSLALEMLQADGSAADGVLLHAPVGAHLDRRLFPKLMKPRWVRRAGQRAISSPLLRPLWKRLLFRHDVPAEYLARFFGEYRRCEAFGQMFDLITPEWFAGLRPLATPGTLLWGAEERVLRAGQHREFLRLLPGAEVVVVRGWDHFPMIEQPVEYTQLVLDQARGLLRRKEAAVC